MIGHEERNEVITSYRGSACFAGTGIACTAFAGLVLLSLAFTPQSGMAQDLSAIPSTDQCVAGAPASGSGLAQIWSRVVSSLDEQERFRERSDLVFEAVVYDRYLPSGFALVDTEGHEWLVSTAQVPYYSPDGVLDTGFMVEERDGREVVRAYYGPGASAFGDDAFHDRYCLQVVRDPARTGYVAVIFRPDAPQEEYTDVEGIAWLSEESGRLEELEYRYLGPEGSSIDPELHGGWIDFRQNADGRWIVAQWQVRMPWFDEDTSLLRGTHIQGGELRSTIRGEDESTRMPYIWPAAISGTVYDSLNAEPMADVEVRLDGTDYATRTNDVGEFRLAQLPGGGQYRVRYVHPRLNRRAYSSRDAVVSPQSGIVSEAHMTVPSAESLFGQVCPAEIGGQPTMIAGSIIDAESGLPMPNALVYASWEETEGVVRRIDSRADEAGAYVICGVPAGVPIAVVADFLVNESLRTLVTAEVGEVEVWDFLVGPTQEVELRGVVTDAVTEQPIRDALVTLVGTNQLVQTNSRGEFSFEGLDPGEYGIKVSHIAYGTEDEEIVLQPGALSTADIQLNSTAIDLPALTVTVEAEELQIGYFETDFLDRRDRLQRQGLGAFIGYEEIKLINPTAVSDIVRAIVPTAYMTGDGVLVIRSNDPGAGPSQITTGTEGNEVTLTVDADRSCGVRGPVIYIDGIPFRGGGENIDRMVNPSLVRAVEVYRRASEIPAEFLDSQSECGVIALWTLRVSGGRAPAGGGEAHP